MTTRADKSNASKTGLRRQAREARRSLSAEKRQESSLTIAQHICATRQYRAAKNIACYLAMPEEVDTWSIIERAWRLHKRVFVPVTGKNFSMRFRRLTTDSRLDFNSYGLAEPAQGDTIDTRRLDLVLAPLVAFDNHGRRIGMGGGYYDRAFAFLKGRRMYLRPKLFGLAFACQQVEHIAASPWDIPLFQIYTENGSVLNASQE